MDYQLEIQPKGLSRFLFDELASAAELASQMEFTELMSEVQSHVDQAELAQSTNALVNLRLAKAIAAAINQVADHWEELAPNVQYWLAGAFLYFVQSDDEEPDFSSPIGFEDDAEVLNACLRFAKLDQLCLNVEDYDHA